MMNDKFVTPKGTVLYLQSIQGRPYLPAQERLIWFREEHPLWGIECELVKLFDAAALYKCTVKDDSDRILAVAHSLETKAGFADYIEKAETSAMGRALAMCGYGTQFTSLELAEGKGGVIDAPASAARSKDTTSIIDDDLDFEKPPLPPTGSKPMDKKFASPYVAQAKDKWGAKPK